MPGPGCTTPPTWNVGGLSPKTEPCEPISRHWAGPQRGTSQPYGDVSQSGPSEPVSWSACGPRGNEFLAGDVCRVCIWVQLGSALCVSVCCAQASQTASSPTLMQGGLRARWSPAAIGWGVRLTDCLRCGAVLGPVRGEHTQCHIADTHTRCNIPGAMRGARAGIFLRGHASRPRRGGPHIPGPCATPAQE